MVMAILAILALTVLTANWAFRGHDLKPKDTLLNYTTGTISVLMGLTFSISVAAVNYGGAFDITIVSFFWVFTGALCPLALGVCYARFVRVGDQTLSTRH